jgi:hypothetical protein
MLTSFMDKTKVIFFIVFFTFINSIIFKPAHVIQDNSLIINIGLCAVIWCISFSVRELITIIMFKIINIIVFDSFLFSIISICKLLLVFFVFFSFSFFFVIISSFSSFLCFLFEKSVFFFLI